MTTMNIIHMKILGINMDMVDDRSTSIQIMDCIINLESNSNDGF